jgi:hypothetical protein
LNENRKRPYRKYHRDDFLTLRICGGSPSANAARTYPALWGTRNHRATMAITVAIDNWIANCLDVQGQR